MTPTAVRPPSSDPGGARALRPGTRIAPRRGVGLAAVLALALLAGPTGGARSDAADAPPARAKAPRDLAGLLRPIRTAAGVPAMGGAIVRGGAVVALGVDGVRKRGAPAAVTTDDRWHLGSCTKAMTATLCAVLVEERRLAWDDEVAAALAPVVAKPNAGWKGATLERLLQHRAGLPTSLDAHGLWATLWAHRGPPRDARKVLASGLLPYPPSHPPGTAFEYANGGYALTGAMAEQATGTAFEELIDARLFRPLGMTSAGFGAPGDAAALDQPWGHTGDGTPVAPGPAGDNPPAITPAGRVHATLADWAKFVALHVAGARGKAPLLPAAAFTRLHTPPAGGDYALGWVVTERPWAGGRVLTHTGSNTMWFCVAWLAPARDFAVLATCNQGGDGAAAACDRVAAALIADDETHR